MLLVPALFWRWGGKDRKVQWQRVRKANKGEATVCLWFALMSQVKQVSSNGKQFESSSLAGSSSHLEKKHNSQQYLCLDLAASGDLCLLLAFDRGRWWSSTGHRSHCDCRACSDLKDVWAYGWPELHVWFLKTLPCLCRHLDQPGGDVLSGSCSILFSRRKESTLHPPLPPPLQALSFTGWPTGEQCSQHNLTADVCPGTICTNVKLNSLLCP